MNDKPHHDLPDFKLVLKWLDESAIGARYLGQSARAKLHSDAAAAIRTLVKERDRLEEEAEVLMRAAFVDPGANPQITWMEYYKIKVARLVRVIEKHYPMFAGHAQRLADAEEYNSAAYWNTACKDLYTVLVETSDKKCCIIQN